MADGIFRGLSPFAAGLPSPVESCSEGLGRDHAEAKQIIQTLKAEYENKLAQKSADLAILNDKLKLAKSSPKSSKKNAVTVFESVDDKSTTVSRDDLCQLVKMALENKKKNEVEEKILRKEIGPEDAHLKPPKKSTLAELKVAGIIKMLNTHETTGIRITSDGGELNNRRKKFGRNEIPMAPQKTLPELMLEHLDDPTLMFLCCASFISLFIGIFVEQDPMGWLEGTAILVAVIVVVMVGSINDYQKESQFRALNAKKDNIKVTVIRGGKDEVISCHDVVVGDIYKLSTGDVITADGYVIGDNNLQISEMAMTGESDMMYKGEYEFSGNNDGQGKMVVLAVGTGSYQGTMEEKMKEADDEKSKSPLQEKLEKLTEKITQVGASVAILTMLILVIRMYISFQQELCCKEHWDNPVHWSEVLGFFISGVTIFVVAVPEGLPLAVTIALAFSVSKMIKDQNLVRVLAACETMGGATTICSDKTGTLTEAQMTVVKVYLAGEEYEMNATEGAKSADGKTILAAVDLSKMKKKDGDGKEGAFELLTQAAVINTMSKTNLKQKDNQSSDPEYSGNSTECGLLKMANILGNEGKPLNYLSADEENWTYKKIRATYPENAQGYMQNSFSSARKRMSTRVKLLTGKYRVFCKGAAEQVLAQCIKRLKADGTTEDMKPGSQAFKDIEAKIKDYAGKALRTIVLAYKDVDTAQACDTEQECEKELIMVGLVGIEDPIRKTVPQAIKDAKRAGITVRMVTGDNSETAAAIAVQCGIIEEHQKDPALGFVWEGGDFREKVNPGGKGLNQDEFDKIWEKLRVMGRSTPLDKEILVNGLKNSKVGKMRQTVAVTGDGTNDAPALKRSDVGFAMGIAGTDVAKNASDIIIMNDDFAAIISAVKWGRCVYDNICKFLQFQLTVNITAIVIACIGSAVLTESPLTAIQMLWVNLIMDSFASLALATEDPTSKLLDRQPYPKDRDVLSNIMVKNMVLHAGWQIVILFTLIFGVGEVCSRDGLTCSPAALSNFKFMGTKPFAIPSGRPASFDHAATAASGACPPAFNPKDKQSWKKNPLSFDPQNPKTYSRIIPLRPDDFCKHSHGSSGSTTQHYTIIFNVFVLLQCFNEINSRKIHNEVNVFEGILSNPLFVGIVVGTMLAQVALVEVPGLNTAFGCEPLSSAQWMVCILLGASVLPMNVLFRYVPSKHFPGAPTDDETKDAPMVADAKAPDADSKAPDAPAAEALKS